MVHLGTHGQYLHDAICYKCADTKQKLSKKEW